MRGWFIYECIGMVEKKTHHHPSSPVPGKIFVRDNMGLSRQEISTAGNGNPKVSDVARCRPGGFSQKLIACGNCNRFL